MKKDVILFILIIFLFSSVGLQSVSAQFSSFNFGLQFSFKPFGGRVLSSWAALEISTLESAGFVCPMAGTSISIVPIGSPSGTPISYFIPAGVTPRTGGATETGDLILGNYGGQTIVECIHFLGAVVTVPLNTITLFGTSGGTSSKK